MMACDTALAERVLAYLRGGTRAELLTHRLTEWCVRFLAVVKPYWR